MSTAQHFKPNRRDVEFNLFEFLDIGSTTLGQGPYAHLDEDTARVTLRELEKFCVNEMASSYVSADRDGLQFDGKGNVTLPPGLRKSLEAWYANGWDRFELPERLGGVGSPPSLVWGGFDFISGSNANAAFYMFGSFVARTIDRLGTDAQKACFVSAIIERQWGGSMVLTEPDAGSDVGAGRTRAWPSPDGDGTWHLEGVKRFITNGDYDLAENIVHLVLARPDGAGPGTKGLSLFIVPKFWVGEDGKLGERNGIVCTNVEKKMGIKASATCEMTLGDGAPCRGLLMGEVHDGIRQMFHVIENARMAVGMKSIATASTAYLNALAYAKERVQGPDLTRAMDKAAPRVRIIEHADVRRMLMHLKSHAEGMRALGLYTAHVQDLVELGGGHGDARADAADKLNDLLLPLVKGYCSDKTYELLGMALQVFGGSGYCQDYPMEQYIRDQKIDTLYEGTTHIQALDLFFRKIARDMGETLRGLLVQVESAAKGQDGGDGFAAERLALGRALADLQGIFGAIMGKLGESPQHVGVHANRILHAVAETVIGWLLFRHAVLAASKLEGASAADKAFYQGKVESCRYFSRHVLPGLTLSRKIIEASELSLLSIDEASF
jgi:alkylation response protein AidB-like acyl-CoA dehydrogenase